MIKNSFVYKNFQKQFEEFTNMRNVYVGGNIIIFYETLICGGLDAKIHGGEVI